MTQEFLAGHDLSIDFHAVLQPVEPEVDLVLLEVFFSVLDRLPDLLDQLGVIGFLRNDLEPTNFVRHRVLLNSFLSLVLDDLWPRICPPSEAGRIAPEL
jgi:hypothetical protein